MESKLTEGLSNVKCENACASLRNFHSVRKVWHPTAPSLSTLCWLLQPIHNHMQLIG